MWLKFTFSSLQPGVDNSFKLMTAIFFHFKIYKFDRGKNQNCWKSWKTCVPSTPTLMPAFVFCVKLQERILWQQMMVFTLNVCVWSQRSKKNANPDVKCEQGINVKLWSEVDVDSNSNFKCERTSHGRWFTVNARNQNTVLLCKKAFEKGVNRPFADLTRFIMNKFEHVQEVGAGLVLYTKEGGGRTGAVDSGGTPPPPPQPLWTERQTRLRILPSRNISFADSKNGFWKEIQWALGVEQRPNCSLSRLVFRISVNKS